ncbi:MAG: hypothetical protein KJ792_12215 [Actinobacteria bacterium]|nr:hypothetical protein [Actinomycetota bacterium]
MAQRPGSTWHGVPDRRLDTPAPLIVLEELNPAGYAPPTDWPPPLAVLDDQLCAQLSAARQNGPATLTRLRTFTGPCPLTAPTGQP